MTRAKGKGSSFEREICKTLGLWWTSGNRDDVFWRSSNSGGRAKTRSLVGQGTFGQYGDVQATDPVGQPLIDLFAIEIKRGYTRHVFADIIDQPMKSAKRPWTEWLDQVRLDKANSKRPFWMLITKRDRRETMVFMPMTAYHMLVLLNQHLHKARPHVRFYAHPKSARVDTGWVFASTLEEFLRLCSSDSIVEMRKAVLRERR
jgi:hypothetical protein